MKTANIADLKNRLSMYLQLVRNGEEVIVKDRNQPVARISPYTTSELSDEERELVASGALRLPEEETADWDKFWDEFLGAPAPGGSEQAGVRAVVEEREEGW